MTAYIETEHFFHYDTKNPVTASALADSLLGIEGVMERTKKVLNKLFDARIKDTEVLITSIDIGSYKENFVVRMLFGEGRAAERNIEKLRRKLGLQKMDLKKAIGIIFVCAMLYVAWTFLPKEQAPATIHIENSFNNLGKELALSKEEVISLFQTTIKNPEELKKNVSQIVHPSGAPHGGTVMIDHMKELAVTPDVVSVIPPDYKRHTPEDPPFQDFDNVQIVIRAIDLDRPATGWAAIIASISEKRLPVILAEDINPATIPAGRSVEADVTVVYKVDQHGNKTPAKYELRKVRP
jgi:hypothetical protein